MKHPDFEKKHFPFTAAILRDGEKDKSVKTSCTTIAGYLCSLSSKKRKNIYVNSFSPLWNGRMITPELKPKVLAITDMETAMDKYPELLLKFGKQDGYWIWNIEAAEKRKLEEAKTVFTFSKKSDEYDDEGELAISKKAYPFDVLKIIKTHCSEERNCYLILSSSKLEADLKNVGWKLKM